MMTRKLAWEKWWDESSQEDVLSESPDAPPTSESDTENDQLQGFSTEMFLMPRKISTPFGLYEAGDPMSPTNLFDCWIGHTNFPICDREYKILDFKISGIGAFKVISKYRFFIGIEKLFNFSDVRKEIEYKICNIDDDVLNFGVY
jgi:hypothetical protein